jgi:HRI1 protein
VTAPLPAGLVGAWTRDSIAVGGAPPAEPQWVRYVQAARNYADLRLDRDGSGAVCFAGTTSWDPARSLARWQHAVDLEHGPADDEGVLDWLADGRMLERGTFAGPAGPVTYEELWRPLPVEGGLVALRSEQPPARLVKVGGHRIVVVDRRATGGGFAARYDGRTDRTWRPGLTLGDPAALPDLAELDVLDDMLPVLVVGAEIEMTALRWTVDEAAARPPAEVVPAKGVGA